MKIAPLVVPPEVGKLLTSLGQVEGLHFVLIEPVSSSSWPEPGVEIWPSTRERLTTPFRAGFDATWGCVQPGQYRK
jgi:hypothetical protein